MHGHIHAGAKARDEAGGPVVKQEEVIYLAAPARSEDALQAFLEIAFVFVIKFFERKIAEARIAGVEQIDIDEQVVERFIKLELVLNAWFDLQE